jgi:hypothetical protein
MRRPVNSDVRRLAHSQDAMTRNERFEYWRNLTFWQRLLFECSIWLGISILIDVLFRHGFDLEWIISGLAWGVFCAVVDHAYCARVRRRH